MKILLVVSWRCMPYIRLYKVVRCCSLPPHTLLAKKPSPTSYMRPPAPGLRVHRRHI